MSLPAPVFLIVSSDLGSYLLSIVSLDFPRIGSGTMHEVDDPSFDNSSQLFRFLKFLNV